MSELGTVCALFLCSFNAGILLYDFPVDGAMQGQAMGQASKGKACDVVSAAKCPTITEGNRALLR